MKIYQLIDKNIFQIESEFVGMELKFTFIPTMFSQK